MESFLFSEAPMKLRVLRESLNLSQRKFAHKLGVSNTQISDLEKGSRPFTEAFIQKVCEVFDVKPDYFVDDSDEEKQKYHSIPPEIAAELQLHANVLTPEDHALVVAFIREAVRKQKEKHALEENQKEK